MNTPRPTRARWIAVAAAVALALLASACRTADGVDGAGATTTTAPPRDGGTLVMAIDQETDGWNPLLSQWTNAAYWVGSTFLEPLATYDEHGETVMWLADSITPTVPGTFDSWRVTAKSGITFHNGETLDADVVKANFDMLRNPSTIGGAVLGTRFKDVVKVDDRTVQVDLTGPWADFPALLTGSAGMMMARETIDLGFAGILKPIGTGPFVFETWDPHNYLKVRKNTNYWRPGEPHLDGIEFRPIVDNKKAVSAFKDGDIDMFITSKAADIDLVGEGNVVEKDFQSEKTFVLLNTAQNPDRGPNPLIDIHARRALAYGTDRAAIRAQVGGGQTLETSTQPMVKGTPWAVPDEETNYYPYDVEKAKAEVEAFKAATGLPSIDFDLNISNAPDDLAIAQTMADQWSAVGSINVRIRPKATQDLVIDTVKANFDAVIQRNYGYPNPDSDLIFFISETAKGPNTVSINFSQYKDAKLDEAAAVILSTTDRAVQRDAYLTVARQLNEGAANQWLYDTPFALIHTPKIRGTESLSTHRFGNSLAKPWLWGSVWRE